MKAYFVISAISSFVASPSENAVAPPAAVPSFRAYDVTREIDLIEEIARINGYDKITPTLPNKYASFISFPIISFVVLSFNFAIL